MKKELAAILVVCMMLFTVIPAASDAGEYPEESYTVEPVNTFEPEDGYPSSLDLRDLGLVTSVKNQGKFGTCWAHAAISCIETSLIKNGYADRSIDLSELHLAYYTFNHSDDPLGGYSGDHVNAENFLTSGADSNYSLTTLAAWRGVALEEDVPYGIASEDLVLEPSSEFGLTKYIVTDVTFLNPYDRGAIKKALNGGDSVDIGYYASDMDSLKVFTDGDVREVSYCTVEEGLVTNHEVTIIGYDDNYPKEKFAHIPAGDGAWLIKNSWGTESTRVGSDGCFWLSYYTTCMDVSAVFSAVPADVYEKNYGYDGGGSMHQNIRAGTYGSMANVFEASSDVSVDAVGFYTAENGTSFITEVYTGLTDPMDPTSGSLASYEWGSCNYMGFHTVGVNPAVVQKGELFSVVVRLMNDNGVELPVDTSVDAIDPATPGVWAEVRTYAEPGQSFVSLDGRSWTDIGTDGMSNVRVKAFANGVGIQEESTGSVAFVFGGLAVFVIALMVIGARRN